MGKKSELPSIVPHHIAFAAGCGLLLAATFYAFVQDYSDREYVEYQQQYRQLEYIRQWRQREDVEEELGVNRMRQLEQMQKVHELEGATAQNKPKLDEIHAKVAGVDAQLQLLKRQLNFAGTDVDVRKYEYTAAAEPVKDAKLEVVGEQQKLRMDLFNKVAELEKERTGLLNEAKQIEEPLVLARKELAALTAKEEELTLALKQTKGNTVINALRDMPGADFIGPKYNLNDQVILRNLPLDVKFELKAARYDRCISCHKGIYNPDPMYSKAAHDEQMKEIEKLEAAGNEAEAKALRQELVPAVMRSHPRLDLFVNANSPHPVKSFGCTVCHKGRPMGTSFMRAAHTPRNEEQKHEWIEKYGWSEMHHHIPSVPMWDDMMLPMQYVEASCKKCHQGVDHVPQAAKLNAGMDLFREQGCANCHIGDTNKDLAWMGRVGPDLRRLGEKTSFAWTAQWIENPWHFRPETKMPRFFGLENRRDAGDQLQNGQVDREAVEVEAIAAYLLAASKLRERDIQVAPAGDPAKGEQLFKGVGCVGCHSTTHAPKEGDRYAHNDHGPDLSRIGEKVSSGWLFAWLKNPHEYWAESRMPSLRLSDQEAADLSAYLLQSMKKAEPLRGGEPKFGEAVYDELITNLLENNTPLFQIKQILQDPEALVRRTLKNKVKYVSDAGSDKPRDCGQGEWTEAQIDAVIKSMDDMAGSPSKASVYKKAFYVGQAMIQQHGCYGCHNIQGWTYAPLTCVNLAGEGDKALDRFDFGSHDFVGIPDTRWDWFYVKLTRPRSFDRGKEPITKPADRLRMPWYGFKRDSVPDAHAPAGEGHEDGDEHKHAASDVTRRASGGGHGPKRSAVAVALANEDEGREGGYGFTHEQVEQLVTALLSFTDEGIPQEMKRTPTPRDVALDRGERVVQALNCTGCHLVGTKPAQLQTDLAKRGLLRLEALVTREAQGAAKNLGVFSDEDIFSLNAPGMDAQGFLHFGRGTYYSEATVPLVLAEKKVRRSEVDPWEALDFRLERKMPDVPEAEKGFWVEYGSLVTAERFAQLTSAFFDEKEAAAVYAKYNKRFVDKRAYERLAGTQAFNRPELRDGAHYIGSVKLADLKVQRLYYEPVELKVRWTKGEGKIVAHMIDLAKQTKGETASQQDAPPSLAFEGGKVHPDWLYNFFHNVEDLRPGLAIRMPSFWSHGGSSAYKTVYPAGRHSVVDNTKRPAGVSGEPYAPPIGTMGDDARELVEYFAALANEPPYGFVPVPSFTEESRKQYEKGFQLLFSTDKGGLGCNQCHSVGQYSPKLPVGPNLAISKRRFKAEWLQRFMTYPAAIYPWTSMPANFYDWTSYEYKANDPLRGLKRDPAELKTIADKLKAVHFYLRHSGEMEIGAGGEP
ncbi:MAG: c-type cytochrome [Planctomycetes bacterium]|nr:c-type cytochrome [Planctomycetota bacterium]